MKNAKIARKNIFTALTAITFLCCSVLLTPSAHAAKNATNYEPKYGPHSEVLDDGSTNHCAQISAFDPEEDSSRIFDDNTEINQVKGATYSLATNTLTLENFKHPLCDLYAREMGDDFTIKVLGDCEINTLEIRGYMHEHGGELGEPLYWGGSLNLTGSGTLTIKNSTADEYDPWGFMIWGEGSESLLKISKHVSLKAYGYKSEPAIKIIGSAGFKDEEAITVDGKPLHDKYAKYSVKGFMNEGEPTLKDYWVDSSEVIITGDGKNEIDNAPVVVSEPYLEYNGLTQELKSVTIDGKELRLRRDYIATYSPASPKNVGTYTATLKGLGDYVGTTKATFTIFPAAITGAKVSGLAAKPYTGKAVKQTPVVKVDGRTLKSGTDYTLSYQKNTKVGTATMTITGKGNYCDECKKTFQIVKAANPMTAKGKTATVKYSAVKKKTQTIAAKNAFTVSKAQGKVSYKKSSGNKKITVSSAGKVTVKKGLKKGSYPVKVKVTAAGNASYKKGSKTVTVTVKIK